MRFEKWQALGNDYLVIEADELPWDLTPKRVRALCAAHFGCHADGILLLSRPREDRHVAELKIFNPDGSEAELSGNGAREAVLYLRRSGWTDSDTFTIGTVAGDITPTLTGPGTAQVAMGKAGTTSKDFPSGPPDGTATVDVGGRKLEFQHVSIGNPQCAIEVRDGLEALDLDEIGPAIEGHELFPNRTNVSFWRRESEDSITARIFERGVGETMSSGTGATGAAVAAVIAGLDNPLAVRLEGGELEVEVGEDLHVNLTGWAVPVCRGKLSYEFVETLKQT